MSKKHMGSSLDDFLKEEGIFEEAQAQAVKEVVAWQLAEAMKKKKNSKNKLATLLKTSRQCGGGVTDPKTILRSAPCNGRLRCWAACNDRAGVDVTIRLSTFLAELVFTPEWSAPGSKPRNWEIDLLPRLRD